MSADSGPNDDPEPVVNDEGEVAGYLCTECGEQYPIEDGIPNLLPPDMREA